MRPGLEQLRDKQFGVFTAMQIQLEYSRAELRARIDSGEWVRVFRGVYREAATPASPGLRVEAARLSLGLESLVAAYHTAAELHGFAVLDDRPTDVLGIRASRSRRLVVHRERVDPAELELVRGTVATNAVRTAVDLARTLPRMDALATLHAALRRGIPPAALAVELDKHVGRRGRRQAAELIATAARGMSADVGWSAGPTLELMRAGDREPVPTARVPDVGPEPWAPRIRPGRRPASRWARVRPAPAAATPLNQKVTR
ncbi:type IV toxin-antitoxin system AbiEi family antitoxin domain-containing protein [Nocardia asteroides]|nr:type IV toxin-antitoxin system AbiEi family antitoxin domain-containing protein [Nocardia asteroides]